MKEPLENTPCPRCDGSGVCRDCQGSGHIPCPACEGKGSTLWHGKELACRTCKGTGQSECPKECPSCNGTGTISAEFQDLQQRKYQPASSGTTISSRVTKALIIACFAVYALAPPDLPSLLPQPYPFFLWNTLVGQSSAWQTGEYWRYITPAFLHGSFWHLGFNMYALWSFGPALETLLGWKRYLSLYLLSAIGGCVLSSLLNVVGGIGASGAIFGVAAAIVVLGHRWGAFPEGYTRSVRNTLLLILAVGFAMGSSWSVQLDNWGHIGGALAGGLYALLIKRR